MQVSKFYPKDALSVESVLSITRARMSSIRCLPFSPNLCRLGIVMSADIDKRKTNYSAQKNSPTANGDRGLITTSRTLVITLFFKASKPDWKRGERKKGNNKCMWVGKRTHVVDVWVDVIVWTLFVCLFVRFFLCFFVRVLVALIQPRCNPLWWTGLKAPTNLL